MRFATRRPTLTGTLATSAMLTGLTALTALRPPVLISATGQTAADVPASLQLRAAEITEFARTTDASSDRDGTRRPITFRIETDGPPACGRSDARPSTSSYAFLIDADKSSKTGIVTRAIPELGIDLQVEMHCDAQRGTFVSEAGDVAVRPAATAGEPHVVEVTVRRESLPSLDFYWIAVARDANRLTRLPGPGRYEAWRPLDQWLH